jgi:hypothetical protein
MLRAFIFPIAFLVSLAYEKQIPFGNDRKKGKGAGAAEMTN